MQGWFWTESKVESLTKPHLAELTEFSDIFYNAYLQTSGLGIVNSGFHFPLVYHFPKFLSILLLDDIIENFIFEFQFLIYDFLILLNYLNPYNLLSFSEVDGLKHL